jgi:hypothetical protein
MSKDTHAQAAEFLEKQLEAEKPTLDAELRRSLASLGAHLAERQAEAAKAPPPATILQFPAPFGEHTRAVSNAIARSALFAPVKQRQFFRHYVVVGQVDGVTVEYKGEQLNQDDHDMFLQLVKMALHQPLGTDIRASLNAVLRGLGRSNNQEQRRQSVEQVSRLVSGTTRLTGPAVRYEGHLLDDASTPQDQAMLDVPRLDRHLAYRLNPRFARLYAESAYTLFDAQERVKLKGRGSELAKWLYLWIIGNAQQYDHKVETIRRMCGSGDKTLYSFRQNLRKALDVLKAAGVIVTWRIDEADLVHIERTPSASQQKHLANKAKKPRAKGPRKAKDFL